MPQVIQLHAWREVPRSEMIDKVIVAVDCARSEAIEKGDDNFSRYVETHLFPFLEQLRRESEEG